MKRAFIFGTRPEILKFAPLIGKLDATLIHTGQHKELAEQALKIFDIEPDHNLELMKTNQEVESFVSTCTEELKKIIYDHDEIWVQGDTMTALSGAVAAKELNKKLVHLEAGLRSHKLSDPQPEELMRIIIDHMADVHLCPLESNKKNLEDEGITGALVVGNTIVDSLNMMVVPDKSPMDEPYALVTIHRREAIGVSMENIFKQLKDLPIKVVFPCHPSPKIRKIAKDVGIEITEPFNYKKMLWFMKHASVIITDSGGIQEEAPSFGVPVVVARRYTERPEIAGELCGYENIQEVAGRWINKKISPRNPFGDGKATERIIKICSKNN